MTSHYDYLKIYYDKPTSPSQNHFFKVDLKEIIEAERVLQCSFPSQLREFYSEIGEGFLCCPHHHKDDVEYDFCNTNRIFWPMVAAHFYRGIIEHQTEPKEQFLEWEGYPMSLETVEMLEPGDLPFFEIGDSSSFMIMKLHSDNPNAVWSDCGVKIEDSFEKFIWRLYYEDPGYYGDIIEAHYA